MSTQRAARSAIRPTATTTGISSGRCVIPRTRLSCHRHQSTSPQPKASFNRRYYLLAIPIAFLPFTFFGTRSKPLDPYTYSDHPIASTSKLTPQHARIRIPLSTSDAALFAKSEKGGEVTIEHVLIKNPDLQIERPYTPVNDVRGDEEIDIVVKRVQGGEVGRMIHRLMPGGQVGLRGPIPTLSLRPSQYDKIVMISTGTGVAPFLQLLNKLPTSQTPALHLIHSLPHQSEDDIDFVKHEALLPRLSNSHPGLTISRPPPGPVPNDLLAEALAVRQQGKKVLVLVCLPQSLMRPLCGGLTINMKQGPILGTLGQMGLTNAEVYKLE